MKELLSSKDLRLLTIVEYVIENPFTTLTEISTKTNISVRTISSSISKINELISPCYLDVDYLGIKLKITSNNSPRYILNQFLTLSLELNILEDVFRSPNITIPEIASKHYVSEHTIRRSLSHVNKVLKAKGFQIEGPNLKFVGDYLSVVMFFILFLGEKYRFIDDMMTYSELKSLRFILDHSTQLKHQISNKQDYSRLILWLYVKAKIYVTYDIQYEVDFPFTLDAFHEAKEHFMSAFNYPLSNELLNYCFSFAFSGNFALSYNHLLHKTESNESWSEILEKINRFVDTLSQKFDLDHHNRESIIVDMFNMICNPADYSFILYSRDATFLKSFSKDIEPLYNSASNTLINIFGSSINNQQADAVLYVFFSHWSKLISALRNNTQKLRVGIFTDSDEEHAYLVKDVITNNFSYGLDVTIVDTVLLKDLLHNMNSLDILITNVPNLSHPQCRIICFSEYPTTDNWSELYREISKQIYEH